MPPLKIGVTLASLRQPLKKALHTAAALGAEGVEINARDELRPGELSATGMRQFRHLLEELNLRVAAVRFQTRRGYDVQEDLDRRVVATKAAMQFARDLGADVVSNHIGRVPEDEQGPRWQTLTEVLLDLGATAHRIGAFLAARSGSESGAELARLVHSLPEGTLGVDLDPGNLVANGFSVADAARALGNNILTVHATDAARDLAAGRGFETQLGRGTVDFPDLLGHLEEFSYRGWLIVERRGADDPVSEVGDAVKFLRSMWE